MSKKDLERASGEKAKAFILLTNKNSAIASREDYRNILIALAIKNFIILKIQIKMKLQTLQEFVCN